MSDELPTTQPRTEARVRPAKTIDKLLRQFNVTNEVGIEDFARDFAAALLAELVVEKKEINGVRPEEFKGLSTAAIWNTAIDAFEEKKKTLFS